MNHLRLMQADDSLCQAFVVGIADTAHRGLDAGLRQPFVPDGQVLHSSVTAMRQMGCVRSGVERLFQRIKSQIVSQQSLDPPTHDPPREDI